MRYPTGAWTPIGRVDAPRDAARPKRHMAAWTRRARARIQRITALMTSADAPIAGTARFERDLAHRSGRQAAASAELFTAFGRSAAGGSEVPTIGLIGQDHVPRGKVHASMACWQTKRPRESGPVVPLGRRRDVY